MPIPAQTRFVGVNTILDHEVKKETVAYSMNRTFQPIQKVGLQAPSEIMNDKVAQKFVRLSSRKLAPRISALALH